MGRNNKKVTMDDIAHCLGISKNSVSLALGNKTGVSEALRERILDKAAELGYGDYAALREIKSRCIIVIVPAYLHNDAFFYTDVFWAVENEAKKRGCITVNISVSDEMEKNVQMPVLPREMNILGILVIGIFSNAYIAELHKLTLPMLSVDIAYPDMPFGCVGSSNLYGGYIAARYLIEKGHKKIGFIGPIHTAQSVFERWCGFYQAMLASSLKVKDAYNILDKPGAFALFDTVDALEPYFERFTDFPADYPTAWFCAGDRIAVALMHVLARRGINIPRDISVMGFDDIQVAEMILPRLTTVRVDRKRMGTLAVDTLLSLHEYAPGTVNINIPGTLVARDSVNTWITPE